jgi:hypothetical protein
MKYILYTIVIVFIVIASYLFRQQYLIKSQPIQTQTKTVQTGFALVNADVKQDGEKLVIHYSVKNISSSDLYIYNKLPKSWDNQIVEHYAYVIVNNGRVALMVGDAGLKGVNNKVIPNLFWRPGADKTIIKVGDTFTDTLSLDLPLKENQIIYPQDVKPGYLKEQVNGLDLKLELMKPNDSDSTFLEIPFNASFVVERVQ